MKKYIFSIKWLEGQNMKADRNTESEIMGVLNKYAKAYADKDIETMMDLFANDPDFVAIGTGRDEWIQGHNQLKTGFLRDFSQADNIEIGFEKVTISNAGNVSWVSGKMTMNAEVEGEEVILCGRLSLVLEKRENIWIFTHIHFSLPAIEQKKGYSYPHNLLI